jgi:GTPase
VVAIEVYCQDYQKQIMPLEDGWDWEELDNTLLSFTEIRGELNYQQAQKSLRELLHNIDLTKEERAGLEGEIERLETILDKLEGSIVQIAAFGMVGRGKSSILNALIGRDIFQTGALHGVTRSVASTDWQLNEYEVNSGDIRKSSVRCLTLKGWGNSQIQLFDTPGIDEVEGETREILAREIARKVDLILFVVAGDISKVEDSALRQLREVGKPIILVFNQIDRYPEADRLAIYAKIRDERVKELLSPDEIVMVAASPLVALGVKDATGRIQIERKRGKPQIEPLKLKIIEILQREGKSLVALNSMLSVDEINERLVERKLAIREEAADRAIDRAVMLKSLAVALNPVTAIDLFTGATIDIALILQLSRIYNLPMTQKGAISLLQKIALTMGGISISEILASVGLSSLKGVLGAAAPITGGLSLAPYLSVAIAQAGVVGFFTYATARVTKTYLANGASWGANSPKTVVSNILASLDETSIINRIKEELNRRLSPN